MKLFELTFPTKEICDCADLYYRSAVSATQLQMDGCGSALVLPLGEEVSFDTFFNLFSCAKYAKHTTVQSVTLELELEGDAEIDVFHVDGKAEESWCWADNIRLKRGTKQLVPQPMPQTALNKTLIARFCDGNSSHRVAQVTFDITHLTTGFVYFSVKAQSEVKLFCGSYNTELQQINPVKVGLVICTFKREKFVKNNVERIEQYLQQNPQLRQHLSVFVVDNGQTLSPQDVVGATLVQNKNLGGSGGFTRGIIEVAKAKHFTHVLLSDDDVVYQPEMFRKTVTLLQTAKNVKELAVGAAMMRLDRPNVQFEFGASWNKKCVHAVTEHSGYDLTKQAALLKNEEVRQIDYSAWWYMCMPICKVEENGLPLPFFIKVDDIEYSVRCKFEIALVNGIGLWHEPFENKYSAYLDYYSMRNLLVADCLTKRSGGFKSFWWVVTNVAIQLVYQRYFVIPFIFSACNDFLKGASFLLDTDGEQLNKQLISANMKQVPREKLEDMGYDLQNEYLPENKTTLLQVLSLNGYFIPSCFYPKQNKKYQTVDMRRCYPRQFYKVKKAVQFNPITQTGFVTTQKVGKLFSAGFKLLGLGFKMLFCYGKAARSYRKNYKKLTSFENWERILEIGESSNGNQ